MFSIVHTEALLFADWCHVFQDEPSPIPSSDEVGGSVWLIALVQETLAASRAAFTASQVALKEAGHAVSMIVGACSC